MICVKVLLIFPLFNQAIASAIPIWEQLTHHEKIGSLTFTFFQLVHLYCKHSDIPDCEKVLTLYGVSNLLKEDEASLDLLDPYQRNARDMLWKTVMDGGFNLPDLEKEKTHPSVEQEQERDLNTISHSVDSSLTEQFNYEDEIRERYPYAVRVLPPPHFRRTQYDESSFPGNQNLGKSLQKAPTEHSTNQKRPTQNLQSHSKSTLIPTRKTLLQNSPIISISPYNSSSSNLPSLLPPRKAPLENSVRRRPQTSRDEREKSDTLYILPSDQRQKPILLRILQS